MPRGSISLEFFKTKTVIPAVAVNRNLFLKSALQYFLIELILIALFLAFIQSHYKTHEFALYFMSGMVLVFAVITSLFLKKMDFAGRFKDIYPNYDFKTSMLYFLAFFPSIYIPLFYFFV